MHAPPKESSVITNAALHPFVSYFFDILTDSSSDLCLGSLAVSDQIRRASHRHRGCLHVSTGQCRLGFACCPAALKADWVYNALQRYVFAEPGSTRPYCLKGLPADPKEGLLCLCGQLFSVIFAVSLSFLPAVQGHEISRPPNPPHTC